MSLRGKPIAKIISSGWALVIGVTVAYEKRFPFDVVTLRKISGPDETRKFAMVRKMRHDNVVSPIEIFQHNQAEFRDLVQASQEDANRHPAHPFSRLE